MPSPSVSPIATPTPEPSSINDILRENNRVRLFVQPLHWTSQHLVLLGCQFRRKPVLGKPKTSNAGSPAPDDALLTKSIIRAARGLLVPRSTGMKDLWMQRLLKAHGIHHSSSPLSFRFAQSVVTILQTDGTFLCSSSTSACPTLAYLDLGLTAIRREKTFKLPRKYNPPVVRLQRKRARRLQPENETEDPYIAAVLIALAQEQRHMQDTSAKPEYKVHLLALPKNWDPHIPLSCLYFYRATIPQAFLDRFDYPSRCSPCDPIVISYRRIPLKPKKEMLQAMGCVMSVIRDSNARCCS